jgi:hypothetical protein
MKQLLLLVAAASIIGCGDDTTSPSPNHDLATVSDFSVPLDMISLSCANILACQAGCGQNLVCQAGCRDSGTTMAKALNDAFVACLALTCAPVDGGTKSCTSATDTSPACLTCLANTATQAMSPGGPCNSEYGACASN